MSKHAKLEIKLAREIEHLARIICEGIEGPDVADVKIWPYELTRARSGEYIMPDPRATVPLWTKYRQAAMLVIADQEKRRG